MKEAALEVLKKDNAFDVLAKNHFITLVLIIVFGIKLFNHKKAKDTELRYFWMTLIACLLLVIEDVAESMTAQNPDLRFWRILLSVIGYTLRPVAGVGLLLVICPPEKRSWRIWSLCLINLAVFSTAFFSPIAFSFGEEYEFIRGPLGHCVVVVALAYIVQVLVVTWRRFYDRKATERWILILCAASCILAAVIDMRYGGCRLNEAIMISSVFFYIFLRSQDNRRDPLTALENRVSFYEDLTRQQKNISAIASIDLNGMKKINDTLGHIEGDKALTEVGQCLSGICNRNTIAYRTGGDEFVILFLQQEEAAVQNAIQRARDAVANAGYSLSVGYAMKTAGRDMEELLHESDQNMYKDKAEYYRQNGMDRRRR